MRAASDPDPMKSATSPSEAHGDAPSAFTSFLSEAGWIVGRSLFPIMALLLILGTLVWGPWVTLVLAVVWWRIVTRIG